jgi:hypothetical protein
MEDARILTLKRMVIGMATLTLFSTLTTGALWLLEYWIMAVALASATIALWVLFIILVTVAITAWWTRQTMRDGAELALRAQDINDRWDTAKIRDLAALVREGAKIGRMGAGQNSNDPLPLMTDPDDTWLPHLVEFETPALEAPHAERVVELSRDEEG